MALLYALIVGLVCVGAARPIASAFSSERSVAELAAVTLLVGALLQLINAAYVQLKGTLRGLAVFRYQAWVTIGCAWVITPPLTYWVGVRSGHGAPGAWVALCVEVTVGVLLLGWRAKRLVS